MAGVMGGLIGKATVHVGGPDYGPQAGAVIAVAGVLAGFSYGIVFVMRRSQIESTMVAARRVAVLVGAVAMAGAFGVAMGLGKSPEVNLPMAVYELFVISGAGLWGGRFARGPLRFDTGRIRVLIKKLLSASCTGISVSFVGLAIVFNVSNQPLALACFITGVLFSIVSGVLLALARVDSR